MAVNRFVDSSDQKDCGSPEVSAALDMRNNGRWRYWLLLAIVAASVLGLDLHEPVPQDISYHEFADRRTVLGVPNFWNVISNVAFLIVGIAGLRAVRKGGTPGPLQPLYPAYAVLFLGVVFVSF